MRAGLKRIKLLYLTIDFSLFFQISLLLLILLYVSSYITICQFRRKADNEDMYAGMSYILIGVS